MATKTRVGILMGGPSREREISFAGGRTVYDNLDKRHFEALPIFIDSLGTPILLEWQYVYKGTIRDFFPPASALPALDFPVQLYLEHIDGLTPEAHDAAIAQVGRKLRWEELPELMDFAFLTLHGAYGEDGSIQGVLEWLGIPYSGCGILGSTMGMDKSTLRRLLPGLGFATPRSTEISVEAFRQNPAAVLKQVHEQVGIPCVVKHPTQGSSIGVQIVQKGDDLAASIRKACFSETVVPNEWKQLNAEARIAFAQRLTDLREALCLPLELHMPGQPTQLFRQPDLLLKALDSLTAPAELRAPDAPETLLVEQFIEGEEFSVIVVENADGTPLALPPTQIKKPQALFDYRSKYLPGLARKVTPIELPDDQIRKICHEAERLIQALFFRVYARIDGIMAPPAADGQPGTVYFNDPNTTSGMLPGSFFFHQAAEIGLNPSQLLSYIILTSLRARMAEGKLKRQAHALATHIRARLEEQGGSAQAAEKIGVFLGGYSTERHIAVESGRNVYEKLSSDPAYEAKPIFVLHHSFLTAEQQAFLGLAAEPPFSFWQLPVNVLLKDNADDIAEKIAKSVAQTMQQGAPGTHPVVAEIQQRASGITQLYAGQALRHPKHLPFAELKQHIDFAFITVHGRPGEDGQMQTVMTQLGIPYNGSGPASSQVTIQKYETNERLQAQGLTIPAHLLVQKEAFLQNPDAVLQQVEGQLAYPLIAKPADDGCSSAVKKIKTREALAAYLRSAFRDRSTWLAPTDAELLKVGPKDEFPSKPVALLEALIDMEPGERFMEVTVGMLTHHEADGSIRYQVFEPSETLATGEVLSLEEKFLAGEGQNITPARFSRDAAEQQRISAAVRATIEQGARTLGIEGYARIDAFVKIKPTGEVKTIFIEANSLPAMTPATCIFHQCALAGYSPLGFIKAIIAEGKARTY